MADFTDQDRELLDFLQKAISKSARTSGDRRSWQELFDRTETTDSVRSVMAAEAVQGLSGSWASSFSYGDVGGSNSTTGLQSPDLPVTVRTKTTKLGQRGVPDIDFVPFNVGTNRFGAKGPSLLGHPISFEVVGPTLKTAGCDWTWIVQEGAGPNGGDLLTLDVRPDGAVATCTTLAQAYSLPNFTLGGATEPNGGLYLIVSDDGVNPGSIPGLTTPMGALPAHVDTARYEVFRIASFIGSDIEIHPNRPFREFFDMPLADVRQIRAITILRPYVTRLAAIPNGSPGRETTFFFVSPSEAASSDLYPPYDGGTIQDGTWLQGGFSALGAPGTSTAVGDAGGYLGRAVLPIPRPLREGVGIVEAGAGFVSPTAVGRWKIQSTDITAADVGKCLHIFNVEVTDEGDFAQGNSSACLGWFNIVQVVAGAPNNVFLRRVAEVDPQTGVVYYGPGPYVQQVLGPESATVYYTVHNPITSLWEGNFDMDKIESARLKHLIDPKFVRRAEKTVSDTTPGFPKRALGSSSGRPDRAIFQTRTSGGMIGLPDADRPGSLLDLGFRVVLFPAKLDGTRPVPDFDHPITGTEVIIDPSVTEAQYLTIDYSAGSVTLSHRPPLLPGGDIVPFGVVSSSTLNPRGEVILYAACVPFSIEKGQKGTGSRVTTRKIGETRDVDSYSGPIQAFIDGSQMSFVGVVPFIGPSLIAPNPVEIVLDRVWEGPETGTIEIIAGMHEDSPSFGVWGYSSRREVVVGSNRVTALGGISSLPAVVDPSSALGLNQSRSVVLRRDVVFTERSADLASILDKYPFDVTYGSSKRSGSLRFLGASQQELSDGSTLIDIRPPNQLWQQYGALVAAQKNAAGLSEIGSDGLMQGPIYFSNGAPILGGSGVFKVGQEGQMYALEILPVVGEDKGVSTNDVFIQAQHRFRLVTKFQTDSFGGATDTVCFLGLVGALAATINTTALIDPLDTTKNYLGIRHVGDLENPVDKWQIVLNSSATGITQTVNLNLNQDTPYYFVMETVQDGTGAVLPYRVKIGVFDKNMIPIYQEVFLTGEAFLPSPSASLNYYAGIKYVSGASRRNLRLYYATLVNRFDLKGPEA